MRRETANLEFNAKLSDTFLKTVNAFANYGNGTIEFGVDNIGEALGSSPRSRKEVEIHTGLSRDKTIRALRSLVAMGAARQVGAGPSTAYIHA